MRRMIIGAAAAACLCVGAARADDTVADAQQRLAERTAARKAAETQPAETELVTLRKQLGVLSKANRDLRAEVERLRKQLAEKEDARPAPPAEKKSDDDLEFNRDTKVRKKEKRVTDGYR